MISDDDPTHKITLNNNEISSSNKDRLLGIPLDIKLNFDSHITSLYKKVGQKISALARIDHYSRSEIIGIKLSSKIAIQLLPTDLDVYF